MDLVKAESEFLDVGEHDSSKSLSPGAARPAVFAVDDDESLAELYAIVLGAAGYCVDVFTDRREALAAFKARAKRPDVLITDYRGRSMSADRFIRECLSVHPSLRILMASGFPEAEADPLCLGPARFIGKPFTPQELLQEVRATLTMHPEMA